MIAKYAFPILVGLIVGCALAIQPIFNTAVSRSSSIWYAALFSLICTVIITAVICFATDRFETLSHIGEIPKLFPFAGICGIVVLAGTVFCMTKLGPLMTAGVTVAAQLSVATACSGFGLLGFEKEPITAIKIVGVILLIVGVICLKLPMPASK